MWPTVEDGALRSATSNMSFRLWEMTINGHAVVGQPALMR